MLTVHLVDAAALASWGDGDGANRERKLRGGVYVRIDSDQHLVVL